MLDVKRIERKEEICIGRDWHSAGTGHWINHKGEQDYDELYEEQWGKRS